MRTRHQAADRTTVVHCRTLPGRPLLGSGAFGGGFGGFPGGFGGGGGGLGGFGGGGGGLGGGHLGS